MDRLVLLLTFSALVTGRSGAQDAVNQYSVVGDVQQPQTYEFESASPVHIQHLLQKAGVIDSGTAIVLRGSPIKAVSSDYIDVANGIGGFLLSPGDVVLFRSQLGRIPNRANAIILFQDCRAELPLPDGFRSVSTLLQQLRLQNVEGVRTIRSDVGAIDSVSLTADESILHSDIIDLTGYSVASHDLAQIFEVLPSAYGQSSNHETATSLIVQSVSDSHDAAPLDLSIPGDSPPLVQMELLPESSVDAALTDPAQTDDDPFRVASLESVIESSASATVSPAAIDGSTLKADPAGSVVLNSIFIAGLLFAMGLILVGWVRTKREQEFEQEVSQSVKASLAEAPRSATPLPAPVLANAESVNLSSARENSSDGDSDILDGSRWFEDKNSLDSNSVSDNAETVNKIQPTTSGSWDDLEDLIQNRLPVDLKQADLPLKVSLFGKPEGPKKLRVDGAHTQIAAPHMASRVRSKKRPAPVVQSSTPSQSAPQTAATSVSSEDFSRLDKALNFLEEQSDT